MSDTEKLDLLLASIDIELLDLSVADWDWDVSDQGDVYQMLEKIQIAIQTISKRQMRQ